MNHKQNISLYKDPLSWQPWSGWSQFFLVNNIQLNFVEKSDTLAIDYERLFQLGIVEVNKYFSNYRTVIVFDLLDNPDYFPRLGEYRNEQLIKLIEHDRLIFITCGYGGKSSVDQHKNITYIKHPYHINRSKFYYTHRFETHKQIQPGYGVWYHLGDENYQISDIPGELSYTPAGGPDDKLPLRDRTWLFAGRGSRKERTRIYNVLDKYQSHGYLFYKNQRPPEEGDREIPHNFTPLPAKYYRNSYVNVFGETNVVSEYAPYTGIISEKTLEPIMKYQLILPCGTPAYYNYLHDLDLRIADDLIIHDWRRVKNTDTRVDIFCKNLELLLGQYTENDFRDIYCDNRDILLHNHQTVFDWQYCHSVRQLVDLL